MNYMSTVNHRHVLSSQRWVHPSYLCVGSAHVSWLPDTSLRRFQRCALSRVLTLVPCRRDVIERERERSNGALWGFTMFAKLTRNFKGIVCILLKDTWYWSTKICRNIHREYLCRYIGCKVHLMVIRSNMTMNPKGWKF